MKGCGIRLSLSSDLLLVPVWATTGIGTVREVSTVTVSRHICFLGPFALRIREIAHPLLLWDFHSETQT